MKFRNDKHSSAHYTSFADVAAAMGRKPVSFKKKKEEIEKFNKEYICKNCGKPMIFIGGNIVVCNCDGKPIIRKDENDKEIIVGHIPSYELLKPYEAKKANRIFN